MSRKILLFTFVTFLSVVKVYGQKSENINFEKVNYFVNSIIVNDTVKFNLSDRTGLGIFGDDTTSIYEDTLFDKGDREFFRQQIMMMELVTWKKDQIKGANVISYRKIKRVFRGKNGKGWDRFRKKYGNCLTSFSTPIFNKSYSYCIFYHWTQCDYLAGGGSLDLFKLENNKWIFVKSYMMGRS